MDNLVIIIVSIVLFITFYYYVKKQNYESFTSSTNPSNGDIVPNQDDETSEIIKRHQVDYNDV